jgi:hypothetical protein
LAKKLTQQTQTPLSQFDFHLTSKDEQTLKAFHALLKLDGITEFSSDNFRRYGLDRFIKDPQHGVGCFFGKLVKNRLVEQVGYKPSDLASNHSRTIKTYRWTEK